MKEINILKLLSCLYLLCITGCNSDVFVDNFLPEVPAVSLSDETLRDTIRFESAQWNLLSITSERGDLTLSDENGNILYLPIKDKKEFQVACTNHFLDFRIERKNGRELEVILYENLYDTKQEFGIWVGNEFDWKDIPLSLEPTSKYRIDSIAYEWDRIFFYDYTLDLTESIVINNEAGTEPVSISLCPFRNAKRTVRFYGQSDQIDWDETNITQFLGSPLPPVTIPDIAEGKPVLSGTQAAFSSLSQEIEAGLDKDFQVQAEVAAGENRRIEVYQQMEIYNIPFTAYISHPISGKQRILHGTLTSKRPFDYLILPVRLN